ncbi:MAG: carboxypeptidase-like regulatory domain-containing protein [Candidatus Binataceae bacterium]
MPKVRRRLCFLTLIVLGELMVVAPGFGASIAGVVVDSAGKPIAGAQVAAQSSSTAIVSMMTSTDKNGLYCIANLHPGSYDLVLESAMALSNNSSTGARATSGRLGKPGDYENYQSIAPIEGYDGVANMLLHAQGMPPQSDFRTGTSTIPRSATSDIGNNGDSGEVGVMNSYLGPEGLTVNWKVSATRSPVASVAFGVAAAEAAYKLCGEP